jgi:DNA-binding beta-propeller fold protein YncE
MLGQKGDAAITLSASEPASLFVEPPVQQVRAFPRISLAGGADLQYLGTFCANAKYKKATKFNLALEQMSSMSASTCVPGPDAAMQNQAPSKMLVPARRVVEDYEPPAYATSIVQPKSGLASIRDTLVTFAYGPARVMGAPYQLTTDSMQRVIISDPNLQAVHVFDPKGKTSFSILGDQGRRLQMPAGVAVDAQDNIYIADSERGIVLVYDSHGRFVRYVGLFHGENMYQRPTGIAIDRKAGRLYLADTPRNLVLILDLQGNVLNKVGRDRDGSGSGELIAPTDIAVSDQAIMVLDANQSRIQVLDSNGNRVRSYRLAGGGDGQIGIAADKHGYLYVSYVARSSIGIYRPDGSLIGAFGQSGSRIGEFRDPKGLWVDGNNRIYVADTENARVQVFQFNPDAMH